MQCMTDSKFIEWLSGFGVKLDEHHNPSFSSERESKFVLLAYPPKGARALCFFATWLVRWLPTGRHRVLWLKHWKNYPPDEIASFEQLRRGCGESRPVGEGPGHLFRPIAPGGLDERQPAEIEEEAAFLGMVLLVMLFDWRAYVFAENHNEYVHLGDEFVSFYRRIGQSLRRSPANSKIFLAK